MPIHSDSAISVWLFRCWLALLCWLPIPLGSNRPWAWSLFEAAVFLLVAVWSWAYACRKVDTTAAFDGARGILLLLAGWLLYQGALLVPLPVEWLEHLSPETAAAHRLTIGFDAGGWRSLALDASAGQANLMKSLAYVAAFALTLLLVTDRRRAELLAGALVLWALCLAVYGVLMHLAGIDMVWFGERIEHGLRATATYPNPNHFAAFLEMQLSLGVGLLIAGFRGRRIETWRQFLRAAIEWILSPGMRLRLMLCVLVIALVATHSRMGNAAFFAALLIAGLTGIALSRHAPRGTALLLASLVVIDLAIVGSWFGVEKLADRLARTTIAHDASAGGAVESLQERAYLGTRSLDMLRDYPLFGTGPGSWRLAFPAYRGPEQEYDFHHAHNDYVEFAAENGLVGFVLLGSLVVWTLWTALAAQYQRRDPLMRGLAFAACMGIVAILIHSSVDFNLRIPANATLFMVLMAFAWIARHLDRRQRPI